jgi:hypothetical protein
MAWMLCGACLALAACTPEGGCRSSITGNDNAVHQACGGSGESSPATVTTPAPVVVPPVVITPVITPPSE